MDAGTVVENANSNLAELTADIVSAYVSKNAVRPEDLTNLISTVHSALSGVGTGSTNGTAQQEKPTPPMSWKKAIKPEIDETAPIRSRPDSTGFSDGQPQLFSLPF